MDHDLRQKLLPPKPPTPPTQLTGMTASPNPNANLRAPVPPVHGVGGRLPSLNDLAVLKKRGQGIRSWISIDFKGQCKVIEADKLTIMRRCSLPARDLRLLDPLFVYPSTILGREKAIVVNLEQIRCIITADECLLLNTADPVVQEYKKELQRRVVTRDMVSSTEAGFGPRALDTVMEDGLRRDQLPDSPLPSTADVTIRRTAMDHDMFSGRGGIGGDDQPFEFKALEVALEAACTFLEMQATNLGREAYPLLEQLAYHISTRNLELVRRLKSNLVAITRRVQKVRDEIEQLMDDDGDMAEMHLTEKKLRAEPSLHPRSGPADMGFGSLGTLTLSPSQRTSVSAPVSPASSPKESGRLAGPFEREGTIGSHFGSEVSKGSSQVEDIEQLEMLLEAYFVLIDSTLNKLAQMSQYIDDTEDFINIQLDNVRNQLIQFELLLTTATFVVTIYGVVAGIFGMNVPFGIEDNPTAFLWILWITGIGGLIIFGLFLWYFRYKNLTIV